MKAGRRYIEEAVLAAMFAVDMMLLLVASAFSQEAPEKRVAPVIGNGDYEFAPELPNHPRDAEGTQLFVE